MGYLRAACVGSMLGVALVVAPLDDVRMREAEEYEKRCREEDRWADGSDGTGSNTGKVLLLLLGKVGG